MANKKTKPIGTSWSKDIVKRLKKEFPTIGLELGEAARGRIGKLRRLLKEKKLVRILDGYDVDAGLVVETAKVGEREYDGIWFSSLADAMAKGRPDTGCVSLMSKIITLNQILKVTTKPIIYDGESGGEKPEQTIRMIQMLERLGVSAVIIEDKKGPKKCSLLENGGGQEQERIENVCAKIKSAKQARDTNDFMVIARIESLIFNGERDRMEDAKIRAKRYIEAGADGIVIHSNKPDPGEVFKFCEEYLKFNSNIPLVAIPTTYSGVYGHELAAAGIRIVIYANHMIRSAHPAKERAAISILENDRGKETEIKKNVYIRECMLIKEIWDWLARIQEW